MRTECRAGGSRTSSCAVLGVSGKYLAKLKYYLNSYGVVQVPLYRKVWVNRELGCLVPWLQVKSVAIT